MSFCLIFSIHFSLLHFKRKMLPQLLCSADILSFEKSHLLLSDRCRIGCWIQLDRMEYKVLEFSSCCIRCKISVSFSSIDWSNICFFQICSKQDFGKISSIIKCYQLPLLDDTQERKIINHQLLQLNSSDWD